MKIPEDFPRERAVAGVPGVQPKPLVRLDSVSGQHNDGSTEREVQQRLEFCADLVTQLATKCKTNRETKYRELSEVQILERLFAQLVATGWGTIAEMKWVIRHAAAELAWTIPDNATALRTMLGYN